MAVLGLPLQISPHCCSLCALRFVLGAHPFPTKGNMDKAHLSLPTEYIFISCEPREITHTFLMFSAKPVCRLHQATCSPVEMIGKGGENPIFTFTLGLPSLIRAAGHLRVMLQEECFPWSSKHWAARVKELGGVELRPREGGNCYFFF